MHYMWVISIKGVDEGPAVQADRTVYLSAADIKLLFFQPAVNKIVNLPTQQCVKPDTVYGSVW